jgi:hypothetical protein
MNRYKPIGWRFESYRHSLSARGIRNSFYVRGAGKDKIMIKTPPTPMPEFLKKILPPEMAEKMKELPGKKEIIKVEMINEPEPQQDLPDFTYPGRPEVRTVMRTRHPSAYDRMIGETPIEDIEKQLIIPGEITPASRFRQQMEFLRTASLVRRLRDMGLTVQQRQIVKDIISERMEKQRKPFEEDVKKQVSEIKAQAEKDVETLEKPEEAGYVPLKRGRGRPPKKKGESVRPAKEKKKTKEEREEEEIERAVSPESRLSEILPEEDEKDSSEKAYERAFMYENEDELVRDGELQEGEE